MRYLGLCSDQAMADGIALIMIRYRGRVGGGAGQVQSGRSPVRMLLTFSHRQPRTDEEVSTLTSGSEHDVGRHRAAAQHRRLVADEAVTQATPSPRDRAAIVRGSALDPRVAAGPRRAGGHREGPTVSWWRSRLGDLDWPPRDLRA